MRSRFSPGWPGDFQVKEPKENFEGSTGTGLDVGGPCLETLEIISENSSPCDRGRLVT